jgi:citrate synthase
MADVVKVEIEGKTYELPVITGSEGEKAIDISKLRASSGYITLDNGFGNTGSCQSAITFLNGEEGILRYRGYPIEQLAQKSSFQEVAYLLLNGELPSQSELSNFKNKITENSKLPEGMYKLIDQFPNSTHPMGVASSMFAALSAYYPEFVSKTELSTAEMNDLFCQLMGQAKVIISQFYRKTQGLSPVSTNGNLSYAGDFLNMMFGGETGKEVSSAVSDAFDVLLTLHADHEQNCSASTVRVVGTSKVNLFGSVSAGINALWGQSHGGANQAVLEMLEAIQADGGGYQKFIEKAKDKNDPFRLMGFGHRVYKKFDPRATIIKKACDTVLEQLGVSDPLLDIAKGLEEVALSDNYFVDRKLYPNVDFYSGIIYRALGIPTNMFTCMFVLGRLPGWMSQWVEMRQDQATKIARPRQIYTGATTRDYSDISSR